MDELSHKQYIDSDVFPDSSPSLVAWNNAGNPGRLWFTGSNARDGGQRGARLHVFNAAPQQQQRRVQGLRGQTSSYGNAGVQLQRLGLS